MKRQRLSFVMLTAVLMLCANAEASQPKTADQDGDGKIDSWFSYDSKGNLKRTARDQNKDGKPDYFTELVDGRKIVLRENDANFDGRIDRRWLTEWDANKKLMTGLSSRNLPQYTTVPGYVTLWSETDKNFDGIIDEVTERGNPNPSQARVGQSMESRRP